MVNIHFGHKHKNNDKYEYNRGGQNGDALLYSIRSDAQCAAHMVLTPYETYHFSESTKNKPADFWCASLEMRSHRLTVRTPGFHPGNPGSIPGEITIENSSCLVV